MTGTEDITDSDIKKASAALCRLLGGGKFEDVASDLRDHLDARLPNCEHNYLSLKHGDPSVISEIADSDLPEFFVKILGTEMFYGKYGKIMREMLIGKEFEKHPKQLLDTLVPVSDDDEHDDDARLRKLKRHKWRPGSYQSKQFVRYMGFPIKFAGTPSTNRPERMEAVEWRRPLGDLMPFQKNLCEQIIKLLKIEEGRANRGILRLPTGSGKTRIAVEALLRFWKTRPDDTRFIMWVGQTEELCEQAFQSFKQVWEERGQDGEPLILHRVWDGRPLPDPRENGIIIAGISQLYEIMSGETGDQDPVSALRDYVGALVVDEAHRSITKMYDRLYESLDITKTSEDRRQIPLLGITATPYRPNDLETQSVLIRYNDNILYPMPGFDHGDEFDESWKDYDDVLERLTDDGVLSNASYRYYYPDGKWKMTKKETATHSKQHKLPPSVLEKMGKDPARNNYVYRIISDCAKKYRSILFFGANVNQAMLMKTFLNSEGIKSAAVVGTSNFGNRKKYIEMFRENKLQVLCNYNVLTTGFDSPNVDAVIIARPTSSRLIYEQMVGRGLRGEKFGGTSKCMIISVIDNIRKYGDDTIEQGPFEFAKMAKMDNEGRASLSRIREVYEHG